MNEVFKNQIRASMQLKETDELINIWKENDYAQWTDEAFVVIGEILLTRINKLPPQEKAKNAPPKTTAREDAIQIVLNIFFLVLIFPLLYFQINAKHLYDLFPTQIQLALGIIIPPIMLCYGLWGLWHRISKNETKYFYTFLVIPILWGGLETLIYIFKLTISEDINNIIGYTFLFAFAAAIGADIITWYVLRKSKSV